MHQVDFHFRSTIEDTILTSRVFMWIYVIPLHELLRWRCVLSKGIALKPLLRFVSIWRRVKPQDLEGAECNGHLVLNEIL